MEKNTWTHLCCNRMSQLKVQLGCIIVRFPKDKERYDSKIVLSSSTLSQKKLLTIQWKIKNITFLQVQKMDCKHKMGGSRWVHYWTHVQCLHTLFKALWRFSIYESCKEEFTHPNCCSYNIWCTKPTTFSNTKKAIAKAYMCNSTT